MTRGLPLSSLLAASLVATAATATLATVAVVLLSDTAVVYLVLLSPMIVVVAALYAAPHALLLGVPAAWLLSRHWPLNASNAAVGGLVIGAAPTGLLLWSFGAAEAVDGNYATLVVTGFCGAAGAVGGLVFYLKLAGHLKEYRL